MREIKFRGKRVDNGEWVYGDLIQYDKGEVKVLHQNERTWDVLEGAYDIIPETVGQFTNLSDWDYGTEIYEGDVVSNGARNYVIKYVNGCYWLVNKDGIVCYRLSDVRTEIKVMGNVHDNPELLTEK